MSFGSGGGFGGFGSTNNSNNRPFGGGTGGSAFGSSTSTGSGLFGSNQPTANNNSSNPFSQNSNSSGGGLFGGGSNNNGTTSSGFGQSGGFGQSSSGGGLFGPTNSNNTSSSGFGGASTTGGGLFGGGANNSTSGGFGSGTGSGFGSNNNQTGNPGFGGMNNNNNNQNGTASVTRFEPYVEKDGVGSMTNHYQALVFHPNFQSYSFEELQLQDYAQGRKFAPTSGPTTGGFGASTGFGGLGNNNANNTGTGFGASTGGFGSANNTSGGGFGTANNTGGFGAGNNNTSGTGLFGKPNNAFGSSNNATGGAAFGSNTNNATTGGFGAANNNTSAGGMFGSKPSGFGTAASTGAGFGSANATGSSGLFGNNNNNASNNQSGGLFGNTNNTQNQSNSPFGGFGQANNAQQNSGAGAFGNTQSAGGGLFGNNNQNNQQQKPGGLFGNSLGTNNTANNQPGQTTGGLFGNNAANNQSSTGATGGLFGPKPATGGGLFGNNNNQSSTPGNSVFPSLNNNAQNQNQQGQAGGGLFGNSQQRPSLFTTPNNNASVGGGGLFGSTNNQQPQQAGGLFGSTNNQQPQNSSLFGNSGQQSQQAQPQAPVSTQIINPYGNDGLFTDLNVPQPYVGPVATPLGGQTPKRARRHATLRAMDLFPHQSTRLISPQRSNLSPGSYSTYNNALRGTVSSLYSSPATMSRSWNGTPISGAFSTYSKVFARSGLASNQRGPHREPSVLNPNAFSPSNRPRLGQMKKLTIDRSLRTQDLFGTRDLYNERASPLKKAVSFDSAELHDGEANASNNGESNNESAVIRAGDEGVVRETQTTPSAYKSYFKDPFPASVATDGNSASSQELTAAQRREILEGDRKSPIASAEHKTRAENFRLKCQDMEPGEYYMIPSKAQLSKLTKDELAHVKNFIVGRENVGEIFWPEADLTADGLDDIIGDIVNMSVRKAAVYVTKTHKPPEGQGLNKPARITLCNAWPQSKTGEPISVNDQAFGKHMNRLKSMPNTLFKTYVVATGDWTFSVQHFSSYELPYDDDETSSVLSSLPATTPSAPAAAMNEFSPRDSEESASFHSGESQMDDTFDFRSHLGRRSLPGAFDLDDMTEDDFLSHQRNLEYTDPSLPRLPNVENSSMAGSFPGLEDNAENVDVRMTTPTKTSGIEPKSILKSGNRQPLINTDDTPSNHENSDIWEGLLRRTLSPKKRDRQALREMQESVSIDDRDSKVIKRARPVQSTNNFANTLDIMSSILPRSIAGSQKKRSDSENGLQWPYPKRAKIQSEATDPKDLAFIRCIKPQFGPQDLLVYASAGINQFDKYPARRSRESRPSKVVMSHWTGFTASNASFEKQKTFSRVSTTDGVPFAKMHARFSFSDLGSTLKPGSGPSSDHEKQMWELAQILFDSQDPSLNEENVDAIRKKHLHQFWKSIVSPSVYSHANSIAEAEERAIAYLSGHNVWDATQVLVDGSDFRLSTMIAQIGGDEEMRKAAATQIEYWYTSNVISEISLSVRALYELMAGNTCYSEGKTTAGPENKASAFNISHQFGMDWRHAFGLKLWYGLPKDASLAEVIEQYDADLRSGREKTHPVPWFVREKDSQRTKGSNPQSRVDVLWSLLKIYAASSRTGSQVSVNLREVVAPENVSGNPLDARLSFQVLQALQARGLIELTNTPSAHTSRSNSGFGAFPSVHSLDEYGEIPNKDDSMAMDIDRPAGASQATNEIADALASTLCDQFSSGHESLPDALFAAAHISSAVARKTTITNLLNTHAPSIGPSPSQSSLFKTLVDDLKIPEAWIYTAKSLSAGNPADRVRCLIRAGNVTEALKIIGSTVAPLAIIEEDLPKLRDLLKELKGSGAEKAVSADTWALSAGIYDVFTTLALASAQGTTMDKGVRKARIVEAKALLVRKVAAEKKDMGLYERAALEEMGSALQRFEGGLSDVGAKLRAGNEAGNDVEMAELGKKLDGYYSRFNAACGKA